MGHLSRLPTTFLPVTRVIATAAQGPQSPAFRIRIGILQQGLLEKGIDVALMPLFNELQSRVFASGTALRRVGVVLSARRSLIRRIAAEPADTAFVQRHADMLPTLRLERLVSKDRRLVLDLDDAIWLDGPVAGGHPLGRLKRGESKVRWLAERADSVLAGNEMLADHLSAWTDRVRIVPSLVDVDAVAVRLHEDAETITLGWIGSPTTAGYLAEACDAVEHFAVAVHPRSVRLLVVGGAAPALRGVSVEQREWSEAVEQEALVRIDIGLMPLPDTSWTRGKCAYKALLYMAAGIPVVADDVGATANVVGDAGCVVNNRDAWVDGLRLLSGSAALRTELGSRGRRRIVEEFSIERWLPVIAGALSGN